VKVAESEKAIHVGYFLNGKRKAPFPGERRVVVQSPEDPLAEPEMRADEVAEALVNEIRAGAAALVVGNLANIDVVGHGEDKAAVLRAVEAVDRALGRVLGAASAEGLAAVVTADHGTAESWFYPEGAIDTGHTSSPVPFVLALPEGLNAGVELRQGGSLIDVAPTMLALLGLPRPSEMTGRDLVVPGARRLQSSRALLLICDGWGVAAPGPGNLISQARTPVMDALSSRGAATILDAAGVAVGLPPGTVGNSEAGHLHLGAARVVQSDRVRIQKAIEDGEFFDNPALCWAAGRANASGARLHLMGIVSFFSSHGSLEHLFALLELARRAGGPEVFVHGFLGRRGEKPGSGADHLARVEDEAARLGVGRLVSVIGRRWALDREQNWDRIEKTYRLLVDGAGRQVP
jgi:2,3-bisphosphoglycerate-independent phosphoglycerate mutase